MTKTVTVALTEVELQEIRHGVPRYQNWVTSDFMQRINAALRQFDADREREDKAKALLNNLTFKAAWNPDASDTMKRLNRAGWDLVRMEEAE
jgi:hypothetical protein